MPKVYFNQSTIDVILDMIYRQESEGKEQFATGFGKIRNGQFVLDCFQDWPDYLFEDRTAGSIITKENAWDWVLKNIDTKDADFVLTMHTHPSWYGVNRPLNQYDEDTFRTWSELFRTRLGNVICINAIVSHGQKMKLYFYNHEKNSFTELHPGEEPDFDSAEELEAFYANIR